MNDKEICLNLIEYFDPETAKDDGFMKFLSEHMDQYFDYYFLDEFRRSIQWEVNDHLSKARDDYEFVTDRSHPVSLDPDKKEIHFGEYILPAYWYEEEMPQKEVEETILKYKLIWRKLEYGEMHFPLLEDWYPLSSWREHYSNSSLRRMELDLEAGKGEDALSLYYLYTKRSGMWEIERVYPDKIKQILYIDHREESNHEKTADVTILLYDGSKCSVRVGTNKNGEYCSTTALTRPGFPFFTDRDGELIQKEVFDKW